MAATEESASGLSAFNINLKAFAFQLLTFLIVLFILRRWVLPKLIATIEERRQTLEESLLNAKQTKEALAAAEEKAVDIIAAARTQADQALADAKVQASEAIKEAEAAAEAQGQRLIDEAKDRVGQEKHKLKSELRGELAELVVLATEKVLGEKIDESADQRLVKKALAELTHE